MRERERWKASEYRNVVLLSEIEDLEMEMQKLAVTMKTNQEGEWSDLMAVEDEGTCQYSVACDVVLVIL